MDRPKASSKKISQGEHDEASAEYQRGMNEIRKQLGPMADSYIQKIKALSPEFAWVNVTFPFGELYARDVVDLKTRELCTVAALTVQGFSLPELKLHIDAALRS
jgi:4-carboxymuconolactone decarboxylase